MQELKDIIVTALEENSAQEFYDPFFLEAWPTKQQLDSTVGNPKIKAFDRELMRFRGLEAFAHVYLNIDITSTIPELLMKNRFPEPDASRGETFLGPYKQFRAYIASGNWKADQLDKGSGWRLGEVYPLTKAEAKRALAYIKQNPSFLYAMAAIQTLVMKYLEIYDDVLERKYNKEPYLSINWGTANNRMGLIHGNTKGFAFLHDMAMFYASQLSEGKNLGDEKDMERLLRDVFKDHVFKSGSGEGEISKCPFSRAFANVFALRLNLDSAGQVLGVTKGNHVGGLVFDMMRLVELRYQDKLPKPKPQEGSEEGPQGEPQ